MTLPDTAAPGTSILLAVSASSPDGVGGTSEGDYVQSASIVVPKESAPAVTASTSVKDGDTFKGTVHWTVSSSVKAHAVRFYHDNILIREVDADTDTWALDLDSTTLSDGAHTVGYGIYDAQGNRVFSSKSFGITVSNTAVVTPPATGGGGSGGSGGNGGSGSGSGGTGGGAPNLPQTPPTTTPTPTPVPLPVPPKPKPGVKLKLLNGGYAQTKAKQGKTFAAAMIVLRSDGLRITAGTVKCSLALTGSKVVVHGWYRKAAACSWNLPKGKSGIAHGTISVTAKGLTIHKSFTVQISALKIAT